MAFQVQIPFNHFVDRSGQPIDSGYVYIGEKNQNPQTNPITVYWDQAATIPATQPLRTVGGYIWRNGSPARVFVSADYSILVRDRNQTLVWSSPTNTAQMSASEVTFLQEGAGAIVESVETALRRLKFSEQYDTFAQAVAACSGGTLRIDSSIVVDDDITVPDDVELKFEQGGMLVPASGVTITIEGKIDAGVFQIFDLSSGGTVVLTDALVLEVVADWWGAQTYATVAAAYASVGEGATIVLGPGTWSFGTSRLDCITKVVTLRGVGSFNYDTLDCKTVISHTGTDAAVMINNKCGIENLKITGGVYGLRLGNNSGAGSVSWGGTAKNIILTGASTAGLHATGVQVGYLEQVFSQSNTGAGMLVSTSGNTHGVFIGCRFYNNDQEGILYTGNAQFKYYGCHAESNQYEGIKNETGTLTGFLWDGGWIENNNQDATHASGYFNVLLNNANNYSNEIRNTTFTSAHTSNNGHVQLKGQLKLSNNTYVGTSLTRYIKIGGVNDVLINDNDLFDSRNLTFTSQNNNYIKVGPPEIINWNANTLLGAGFNNVPRLVNCIVTNTGATGTLTFELPAAAGGFSMKFVATVAQVVRVGPASGDQIIPTTASANLDIISSGALGESVSLDATDAVYWAADPVGTWVSE